MKPCQLIIGKKSPSPIKLTVVGKKGYEFLYTNASSRSLRWSKKEVLELIKFLTKIVKE